MNNVIYRVVIKVSYHEAFFDFTDSEAACSFASAAVTHSVANEDTKQTYVNIRLVTEGEDNAEE